MDMVERVAAAILGAEGVHLNDAKDWEKDQYRDMARAAIEAMREPTEAMVKSAYDYHYHQDVPPSDIWKLMVGAALRKV